MQNNPMKVVCAWCQKVLVDDPDSNAFVSHGICEGCAAQLNAQQKVSLEDLLNRLSIFRSWR